MISAETESSLKVKFRAKPEFRSTTNRVILALEVDLVWDVFLFIDFNCM